MNIITPLACIKSWYRITDKYIKEILEYVIDLFTHTKVQIIILIVFT